MKHQNSTSSDVGALTRTFGKTPGVRLLEALVRLAPVEFTRAEAMNEAGLHKPSANRTLDKLENDGFIVKTPSQRPVRYRVNEDNPLFRLVSIANAFSENLIASPKDERAAAQGLTSASRALKRLEAKEGGPAAPGSTARPARLRRRPRRNTIAR